MRFIPDIDIQVETQYLPQESQPELDRYVFAYTITITNQSVGAVKLLTRTWRIQDLQGKIQEVHGDGVIGQQPRLEPGESFQYTSGAIIETNIGTMEGHYEFITDEGDLFDAPIPTFTLADPSKLH